MTFDCDALIFDLDGVLVDSNAVAEKHWALWARRHGVSLDAILAIHHGRPTIQTIRELAPHLDAASEARAKETAEADDTEGLQAFPGAHRLLGALPGGRWAIVTSGTRRTATIRLTHTGLPIPGDFITADDVTRGKPDPEPYRKAIEQLGCSPARCVVIEDAPAGIASAQAACARVIAVATTNPPAALSAAEAIVPALDAISLKVLPDRIAVTCAAPPER